MWNRQNLITRLQKELPGERAHMNFYPYRIKNKFIETEIDKKLSAIGIHLYPEKESVFFILIKRPNYNGYHSGQIAFPGGKKDATDINLLQTAKRESFEELNISMNIGELICELTPVYIPVSNFLVQPFVFLHHEKPNMIKNHEVAEVIEISLDELLNEENLGEINLENIGLS
ncbi:MAG: CoA pyrophosphatase, partial [Bacteroidetes bacterium]|nr:CoA pyrophosphatase [Bacteroidota bacterium]